MLPGIVLIWSLTAFGLWLVTHLIRGVRANSTRGLFLAALVLGLVNYSIRPLLWLLTLPFTIMSFGLFALLINALMISLTAWLVPDFEVDGFGSALGASLVMALVGLAGFVLAQWLFLGQFHWFFIKKEYPNGVYL